MVQQAAGSTGELNAYFFLSLCDCVLLPLPHSQVVGCRCRGESRRQLILVL